MEAQSLDRKDQPEPETPRGQEPHSLLSYEPLIMTRRL
jgi:hypothetical protein